MHISTQPRTNDCMIIYQPAQQKCNLHTTFLKIKIWSAPISQGRAQVLADECMPEEKGSPETARKIPNDRQRNNKIIAKSSSTKYKSEALMHTIPWLCAS
mmetsp:Transcript_20569/g.42352  ORF Transcript_20569/g.42352 Transcript_20569/m.42352 type:complete len:100 (-) Transcript_20569:124-423(-)